MFAAIVLGIALMVFAIIFFFQRTPEKTPEPSVLHNEATDTIAPNTAIISPEESSWHNAGFIVEIRDGDLGSGFASFIQGEHSCQYLIEDLETREFAGGFRPCQEARIFVPVGEDKVCSSFFEVQSGKGRCMVSAQSIDKAGNESRWESKIFLIDMEPPIFGPVLSLPVVVLPGEIYTVESRVSDNARVTGCSLLIDNQKHETGVFLTPIPCEGREECKLSAQLTLFKPGEYEASFACFDSVGNIGAGEPFSFRVFINEAPEISLCRVVPATGNTDTEFQFSLEAIDPDGDQLSFSWEFGDGTISGEQSPIYTYNVPGTFMPKITVQDPAGEKVSCNTAWIVVRK